MVEDRMAPQDRGQLRQLLRGKTDGFAEWHEPMVGQVGIGQHDAAAELEQNARVDDPRDREPSLADCPTFVDVCSARIIRWLLNLVRHVVRRIRMNLRVRYSRSTNRAQDQH